MPWQLWSLCWGAQTGDKTDTRSAQPEGEAPPCASAPIPLPRYCVATLSRIPEHDDASAHKGKHANTAGAAEVEGTTPQAAGVAEQPWEPPSRAASSVQTVVCSSMPSSIRPCSGEGRHSSEEVATSPALRIGSQAAAVLDQLFRTDASCRRSTSEATHSSRGSSAPASPWPPHTTGQQQPHQRQRPRPLSTPGLGGEQVGYIRTYVHTVIRSYGHTYIHHHAAPWPLCTH